MLIGRLNVAAAEVGLKQEHVTRVRPYLCTLQGESVYSSISELYDSSDISMSAVTSGCPATPTSLPARRHTPVANIRIVVHYLLLRHIVKILVVLVSVIATKRFDRF